MRENNVWAVCPRPDEIAGSKSPRLFPSLRNAKRFLSSPVRFSTPKKIAADLGIPLKQVLEDHAKRKQERLEALCKVKRGELNPLNFPPHLRRIRNREQGWGDPVPVRGILSGPRCDRLLRDFYPLGDLVPMKPPNMDGIIRRVFDGNVPDYTCLLAENWKFDEIAREASMHVGYEFEGRKHGSIAEIILKALYDLERSLLAFHATVSADSVALFWTSWNFQRHLAEFSERVYKSPISYSLSDDPHREARAACLQMNVQLAVYAHEITSRPTASDFRPTETIAEQIERFRRECNLSVDALANEIGVEPRSVYRHLAGVQPRLAHIGAYERGFSKLLKRDVVIKKMTGKRQ